MASTFAAAGPPPPGVTPNFIDPPDTLYCAIITTTSLIISITSVFAVCRLVARGMTARISLDDYLLVVAWSINVGYNAVLIWQSKTGFGRHLWDVRASDAVLISQQSWALELIYCPLMWLAKASLLFHLQGIFAPLKSGAVFIAIQVLIWANLAFYTAIFIAVIFMCSPQEKIWDSSITSGHCLNRNAEILAAGIFNCVSDVFIFVLPLWAIWHLHLSLKHKLGVSGVFLTGLVAVSSSLGRVIYSFRSTKTSDTTYVYAQVSLWTLAEIASILLCICFPAMPLFYKVVFRRKMLLRNGSYGSKPRRYRRQTTGAHQLQQQQQQHSLPPAGSMSSYWRKDQCYSCRSGAHCVLHGDATKSDCTTNIHGWSSGGTDEGITASIARGIGIARTHDGVDGIHQTISIELTSKRESAESTQDLV
ncbi:hypothetical protein UA08_05854 [Talaromyces atroroseus]|uniref:Rhodopsin domain-containing protein n=1 Tax=Talaromyces atroroseus TaxID=1441469 RepID=A0A225AL80_TALAT|nr:hypothetical protein UA08_05854 [Talaromyces atroroseus]OKL59074.1 hypothetical protein UA08_05854 [Talaromyces atroroseus]